MKIKNKLTIIFTVIIAIIFICLNFYIYLLSRTVTQNDFYTQLKDRAIIGATVYLEADEQSSAIIDKFEKNYLDTLPGENVRFYNIQNKELFARDSSGAAIDFNFLNEVRQQKEARKIINDRQYEGISYEDNQGDFVIVASASDLIGLRHLSSLKDILIIGFILSIVVVFISGRYFTKLMLTPVTDISHRAAQISETNLHLRLNEGNKKDELAELSIIINRMLQRLEKAFDLQGTFVSNASHELRTPLTSIIVNIEVTLNKARTQEEYSKVLESILSEAEKLHKLVDGLLLLAQSSMDFSLMHLTDVRIDEMLFDLRNKIRAKSLGCVVHLNLSHLPENPSALIIPAVESLLETALLNILENACKFSEGKDVNISLDIINGMIRINFVDQGIGIDANELSYVKESFFRGSNAHDFSGSGIGLSLSEAIIKMHNGQLNIVSELNKGTTVEILFPVNSTF